MVFDCSFSWTTSLDLPRRRILVLALAASSLIPNRIPPQCTPSTSVNPLLRSGTGLHPGSNNAFALPRAFRSPFRSPLTFPATPKPPPNIKPPDRPFLFNLPTPYALPSRPIDTAPSPPRLPAPFPLNVPDEDVYEISSDGDPDRARVIVPKQRYVHFLSFDVRVDSLKTYSGSTGSVIEITDSSDDMSPPENLA